MGLQTIQHRVHLGPGRLRQVVQEVLDRATAARGPVVIDDPGPPGHRERIITTMLCYVKNKNVILWRRFQASQAQHVEAGERPGAPRFEIGLQGAHDPRDRALRQRRGIEPRHQELARSCTLTSRGAVEIGLHFSGPVTPYPGRAHGWVIRVILLILGAISPPRESGAMRRPGAVRTRTAGVRCRCAPSGTRTRVSGQ